MRIDAGIVLDRLENDPQYDSLISHDHSIEVARFRLDIRIIHSHCFALKPERDAVEAVRLMLVSLRLQYRGELEWFCDYVDEASLALAPDARGSVPADGGRGDGFDTLPPVQ